jgi:hypothetical protein
MVVRRAAAVRPEDKGTSLGGRQNVIDGREAPSGIAIAQRMVNGKAFFASAFDPQIKRPDLLDDRSIFAALIG